MVEGTNRFQRYTVTYGFNGYLREEYAEAVIRIRETIAEMHREGTEIEFLGATLEVNGAGQLTIINARYRAPTKGTIGRLNCRARLPACGEPQQEEANTNESEDRSVRTTVT